MGGTVVGEYARGSGAVALYQRGEDVAGEFGVWYAKNAELTAKAPPTRLRGPRQCGPGARPRRTPCALLLRGRSLGHDLQLRAPVEDAGALQAALGGAGTELRSRAGSHAVMHAYPEHGIAFSAEDGRVQFVELFPPLPRERYEAEIYRDPGPFIR